MQERYIISPYLWIENINGDSYVLNHLCNRKGIKYTEEIKAILNYFSKLRSVPEDMKGKRRLIEKMNKLFFIYRESEVYIPSLNVELELTNYCNANCEMCPREHLVRNKGYMKRQVFERLIKELQTFPINEIEICGLGEPLLHKHVAEYISILKKQGYKKIRMVTNASLLSEEKAEEIVLAGLDEISISFHKIDKVDYEINMKGLQYEKSLENVKNFFRRYSEKVHIIINSVYSQMDEREYIAIRKFWNAYGITDINFQKEQSRAGNLFIRKSENITYMCPVFEQGLFISWQGDILSCSNNFDGRNSFGNVNEVSLKESLLLKEEAIHSGKRPDFCRYCDYDFKKIHYLKSDFYKYLKYREAKDD